MDTCWHWLEATLRLHDFLDYWARERPATKFVVAGERSLSYAEAAGAADRLANRLLAGGCRKGSRVAVLARNALWYPVFYFAAAKAGVVLVPVNWRLAPRERVRVLSDAAPSVLVVGEQCIDGVEDIRGELQSIEHFVAEGEEPRRGWEALARWMSEGSATPPEVEVGVGDPLYQMYTSGTTGPPKGAVLSHGAVTANVMQVGLAQPVAPGERGLVVLPMFHAAIIPAAFAVAVPRRHGGRPRRVRAGGGRARARRTSGIGVVTLVPAMLHACLAVGGVADRRYERLRSVYYGASAIAESTLRGALEAFGCGFVQSYGLTEAAQALTFLSPADHEAALDAHPELLLAAGRPAVGTSLRIVDPDGTPARGGRGEIVARGPQLMSGYWQRPGETSDTLRDGWLHTGDVGRIDDDGYLFVEDRIKDMVVSGGENVYPRVIEDVLFAHPAIAEAAVIGVPDERWGETVKAIVALRPGSTLSEKEIIEFCRPRLAGFERPRSVDFVDALPRTATGKVLKRVLREPYWAGRARRVSGA